MTDYLHHHHLAGKTGSEYTLPSSCCTEAVESLWRRRLDDAVHTERRRIILEAAAAVTAYCDAAASLLDLTRQDLVYTVKRHVLNAIKHTGCICPSIDVRTLGQATAQTIPGRDSRCGMHDTRTG